MKTKNNLKIALILVGVIFFSLIRVSSTSAIDCTVNITNPSTGDYLNRNATVNFTTSGGGCGLGYDIYYMENYACSVIPNWQEHSNYLATVGKEDLPYIWDTINNANQGDSSNYCLAVTTGESLWEAWDYTGYFTIDNTPPVADFNYTPLSPDEGELVNFTDNSDGEFAPVISWYWDFGDGETSTLQNPTHTFMDNGTYTVELIATDAGGLESDPISIDIDVADLAPTANFTEDPLSPDEGEVVQFNDASTSWPDDIVSWYWDFGDGETSTLQNPTHTFLADGNYIVTLTVEDEDGSTDTFEENKTVNDVGPTANFTEDPLIPEEGQLVQFNDTSVSYDNIVSWYWDFGDGETSTLQNPTHTFSVNATYNITLTVTDVDGDVDTFSEDKTVVDASPVASFTEDPLSPFEGELVQFNDTSVSYDNIVSWLWKFGDGETSTLQNPTHTYADDGNYTVQLFVQDSDGSVDSFTETKVVQNANPVIESTPITTAQALELYTYDVDASDVPTDTLTYSLQTAPDGMVINPVSGVIAWTPYNNQSGINDVEVLVEDEDGGSTVHAFTITVYSWSIDLEEGWNFFSIPLVPEDPSIETVVNSIDGNFDIIMAYQYNPTTDEYEWHFYDSNGVGDLATINPGYGYHINMLAADTLEGIGDKYYPNPSTPPQILVDEGWAAVGHYGILEILRDDALETLDGRYAEAVFDWDENTGTLVPVGPGDNFVPGEAYWVFITPGEPAYYAPSNEDYNFE